LKKGINLSAYKLFVGTIGNFTLPFFLKLIQGFEQVCVDTINSHSGDNYTGDEDKNKYLR